MELFRQFFVDLAVEFGEVGFADEGFQDFAFFVDEDGSRVNLRAEGGGGGFSAVVGDGEVHAFFGGVGLYGGEGVEGQGDTDDLEVRPRLVVVRHFDDQGHFFDAAGAGGIPEIDEADFAVQGAVVYGAAVEAG